MAADGFVRILLWDKSRPCANISGGFEGSRGEILEKWHCRSHVKSLDLYVVV